MPEQNQPLMPRGLVGLVGVAAFLVAILAAREVAWLLAPCCLAFVIVVLVHPVQLWFRRRGIPAWLLLPVMLVVIYALVIALVAVVIISVARLATLLPTYGAEAAALLQGLTQTLTQWGLGQEQARAMLAELDVGRLASLLTSALSSVVGLGANLVFLLSLLLFMGVESLGVSERLSRVAEQRPELVIALRGFARRCRRFFAVSTVFAVVVGGADTIFLAALGIPLAALWGLLAAVCNYIPYVGFIIGLVPPALLGLLIGGWTTMLTIIVVYVVLNSLLTSLLPPYFVGDAVELSIVVTLVSVLFWSWVLGPVGAVLAVPLTLLVKAVLVDADPRAAWAQALLGSIPGRERRRSRRKHG